MLNEIIEKNYMRHLLYINLYMIDVVDLKTIIIYDRRHLSYINLYISISYFLYHPSFNQKSLSYLLCEDNKVR